MFCVIFYEIIDLCWFLSYLVLPNYQGPRGRIVEEGDKSW